MQKGINRANLSPVLESLYKSERKDTPCVFISHKSEDKEAARMVAKYLAYCGIDYYLDENDPDLQCATANGDAKGVVEYIQRGLESSTHILVLVTEETKKSWWVPYEIGFAKCRRCSVASLLLWKGKKESIPSFLRIEKCLYSVSEFIWSIQADFKEHFQKSAAYEILNESYTEWQLREQLEYYVRP